MYGKAAKLTGNSYIEDFDIDITGVKELTIEMTGESQYVEKKDVILLDGLDYPVLAVSEVKAQR